MTVIKGSSDPSHFIFEINVGKSRIRHTTTLKLNNECRIRLVPTLISKIKWLVPELPLMCQFWSLFFTVEWFFPMEISPEFRMKPWRAIGKTHPTLFKLTLSRSKFAISGTSGHFPHHTFFCARSVENRAIIIFIFSLLKNLMNEYLHLDYFL